MTIGISSANIKSEIKERDRVCSPKRLVPAIFSLLLHPGSFHGRMMNNSHKTKLWYYLSGLFLFSIGGEYEV